MSSNDPLFVEIQKIIQEKKKHIEELEKYREEHEKEEPSRKRQRDDTREIMEEVTSKHSVGFYQRLDEMFVLLSKSSGGVGGNMAAVDAAERVWEKKHAALLKESERLQAELEEAKRSIEKNRIDLEKTAASVLRLEKKIQTQEAKIETFEEKVSSLNDEWKLLKDDHMPNMHIFHLLHEEGQGSLVSNMTEMRWVDTWISFVDECARSPANMVFSLIGMIGNLHRFSRTCMNMSRIASISGNQGLHDAICKITSRVGWLDTLHQDDVDAILSSPTHHAAFETLNQCLLRIPVVEEEPLPSS